MFKDEYRRMNDSIHASEALIRRTMTAAQAQRQRQPSTWKPLMIAALCVLLVAVPTFLKLTYHPSPAILDIVPTPTVVPVAEKTVPASTPVSRDVTLQYVSSYLSDEYAYVFLNAHGSGVTDRLILRLSVMTEGVDEPTQIQTGYPLSYDPATQTASYMLTLKRLDKATYLWHDNGEAMYAYDYAMFDGALITITLNQWEHTLQGPVRLAEDWNDLPQEPETFVRDVEYVHAMPQDDIFYRMQKDPANADMTWPELQTYYNRDKVVLKAGEPLFSIAEGIDVVAAGYTGGKLHVQMRAKEPLVENEELVSKLIGLSLLLLPEDIAGQPLHASTEHLHVEAEAGYSWYDPKEKVTYLDVRFPLGPQELEGYTLYAFTPYTANPTNPQSIAFRVGESTDVRIHGDFVYAVQGDGSAALIQYTGSGGPVVVPDELDGHPVSSIGTIFMDTEITSITLPGSIRELDGYAFYECKRLAEVNLSEGLLSIGDFAFASCQALTRIDLPDSVTHIGRCAFSFCQGLSEVDLPASLTYLGSEAFSATNLTSIVIPDGLTTIEDFTFTMCFDPLHMTVPASVTDISPSAYQYRTVTMTVEPRSYAERYARVHGIKYDYFYQPGRSDQPHRVSGDYTYSCTRDGRIQLERYTGSAEEVVVPDTLDGLEVCSIGIAFAGNTAIRRVTLPDVSHVADMAFYGCTALESVTLSGGTTEIGKEAFSGCTSLQEVQAGSFLERIGRYAFLGCDSLKGLVLPPSVTEIHENAFGNRSPVTVIVTTGSFAEAYAMEHSITFAHPSAE